MKSMASILVFSIFNLSLLAESHRVTRTKLKLEDFVPTNVELLNSSGEKVSKESVTSKYTLVYFTATWCGPCRRVTENLKKIKTKYHDEVEIVLVSYDPPSALKRYMSDKNGWYAFPSDFYTKDEKVKLNKLASPSNKAS